MKNRIHKKGAKIQLKPAPVSSVAPVQQPVFLSGYFITDIDMDRMRAILAKARGRTRELLLDIDQVSAVPLRKTTVRVLPEPTYTNGGKIGGGN